MATPFADFPRLYLITDRTALPGAPANRKDALCDAVDAVCAAGVRMVQLREKDLTGRELQALAARMREITARYDAHLYINDRTDIALVTRAAGVHLPQSGFSAALARDILGAEARIGVSTHSAAEVRTAVQTGADFVTFGPVYETASKRAYGPPVGVAALREVTRAGAIPVYGLGGITPERVAAVLDAGAHGVAMISALLAHPDPAAAAREMLDVVAAHKAA